MFQLAIPFFDMNAFSLDLSVRYVSAGMILEMARWSAVQTLHQNSSLLVPSNLDILRVIKIKTCKPKHCQKMYSSGDFVYHQSCGRIIDTGGGTSLVINFQNFFF